MERRAYFLSLDCYIFPMDNLAKTQANLGLIHKALRNLSLACAIISHLSCPPPPKLI